MKNFILLLLIVLFCFTDLLACSYKNKMYHQIKTHDSIVRLYSDLIPNVDKHFKTIGVGYYRSNCIGGLGFKSDQYDFIERLDGLQKEIEEYNTQGFFDVDKDGELLSHVVIEEQKIEKKNRYSRGVRGRKIRVIKISSYYKNLIHEFFNELVYSQIATIDLKHLNLEGLTQKDTLVNVIRQSSIFDYPEGETILQNMAFSLSEIKSMSDTKKFMLLLSAFKDWKFDRATLTQFHDHELTNALTLLTIKRLGPSEADYYIADTEHLQPNEILEALLESESQRKMAENVLDKYRLLFKKMVTDNRYTTKIHLPWYSEKYVNLYCASVAFMLPKIITYFGEVASDSEKKKLDQYVSRFLKNNENEAPEDGWFLDRVKMIKEAGMNLHETHEKK